MWADVLQFARVVFVARRAALQERKAGASLTLFGLAAFGLRPKARAAKAGKGLLPLVAERD